MNLSRGWNAVNIIKSFNVQLGKKEIPTKWKGILALNLKWIDLKVSVEQALLKLQFVVGAFPVCVYVCFWFCCVDSFFICWRCFSFSRLCLPVDFCHVHFSITFGLIRWNCETNKKKYISFLSVLFADNALRNMVIKTDVLKNKKTEKSTNNKIMSKRRHRYVFVCMENLMKVRNLLEKHTFLINNANKSLHFRFYFCCQFKKKRNNNNNIQT